MSERSPFDDLLRAVFEERERQPVICLCETCGMRQAALLSAYGDSDG